MSMHGVKPVGTLRPTSRANDFAAERKEHYLYVLWRIVGRKGRSWGGSPSLSFSFLFPAAGNKGIHNPKIEGGGREGRGRRKSNLFLLLVPPSSSLFLPLPPSFSFSFVMNKIVLLTHFVSSGSLPLPPLSSYRGGSPLLSCLLRLLLPLLGRVFFGLADRSDNWLRSQARFLCGGCEGEREEENGAFPFVARGTLEGRGFSASSSSFSTLPRSL